ncbi:hypothetical protein FALBO_11449 [Fusarium albosuccineum]|uniref:Uncharacterized protein n=1 Tax=Fusarium albosuccineum TaxID=1237068 RepID=A0A8H4L2J0_9HYPO|nr:hypothetical protein FALBO_11449 [Fusarium albosuccineum]
MSLPPSGTSVPAVATSSAVAQPDSINWDRIDSSLASEVAAVEAGLDLDNPYQKNDMLLRLRRRIALRWAFVHEHAEELGSDHPAFLPSHEAIVREATGRVQADLDDEFPYLNAIKMDITYFHSSGRLDTDRAAVEEDLVEHLQAWWLKVHKWRGAFNLSGQAHKEIASLIACVGDLEYSWCKEREPDIRGSIEALQTKLHQCRFSSSGCISQVWLDWEEREKQRGPFFTPLMAQETPLHNELLKFWFEAEKRRLQLQLDINERRRKLDTLFRRLVRALINHILQQA